MHWRVRNGEVPDELNPIIWWLHIGANDIRFNCTANEIVVGIMRIVDEIRQKKPHAIIVVNAILPRNDIHSDFMHTIQEVNKGLETSVHGLYDKNIYVFDAFLDFFDKSTQNIEKGLHHDFIHLTLAGYDRWARAIMKWTNENLNIDLSE